MNKRGDMSTVYRILLYLAIFAAIALIVIVVLKKNILTGGF